jgi:signal peptidase II
MRTWLVSAAVVAVDQVGKALAGAGILAGPGIEPVTNPTLALGIAGSSAPVELVAGIVALVAALFLMRRPGSRPAAALGTGLVVGGSLGNLLDRALLGSVRDFLVGPAIVYNPADVALVAGVLCCLLVRWRARIAAALKVPASGRDDGFVIEAAPGGGSGWRTWK